VKKTYINEVCMPTCMAVQGFTCSFDETTEKQQTVRNSSGYHCELIPEKSPSELDYFHNHTALVNIPYSPFSSLEAPKQLMYTPSHSLLFNFLIFFLRSSPVKLGSVAFVRSCRETPPFRAGVARSKRSRFLYFGFPGDR
jgi:hypothetical protein